MPHVERWTLRVIPCLLAALPAIAGAAGSLPALRVSPDLLGGPAEAVSTPVAPPPTSKATPIPAPAPAPVPPVAPLEPEAPATSETTSPAPSDATQSGPASVPASPVPAPASSASPTPPSRTAEEGETVIDADRIDGQQDVELVATGNVVLQRDGGTVRADRLVYREALDEAEAEGNVSITRGEDRMSGPKARMRLDEQTGEIEQPVYSFTRTPGRGGTQRSVVGSGEASVLHLEGENQYRLEDATWSTCKAPDPDWYVRASDLKLDYDRNVGVAKHGSVVFKDVPIFYLPWVEFPLAAQRKSGVLPPTVGSSNKTGFDLTVPYYLNIAPNYDATLVGRYMGRRGLQLGGEYRYLTPTMTGATQFEWLPDDRASGQNNRAAGSVVHSQNFGGGWSGGLNLNGVSDNAYFEDLSSRIDQASQTDLVREATLNYSPGSWWSATALMQSYQTLSGSEPYRRLPRITVGGNRLVGGNGELDMRGEFVRFAHPNEAQPEGNRSTFYPSLRWPLGTAAINVTPKIGVHSTHYSLDRPLAGGRESISRTVPIASLDSTVAFERDTSWRGRKMIQTLEPRLYYVYIPYRRQDDIPNFDSGLFDFNFWQMFSENIFSGGDRIANANQITAAVTSRLIDADTGDERIRAAIGQRYYFNDQRVTLPGVPARTGRRADVLASLSGRLSRLVTLATDVQYNPRDDSTERYNFDLRYQPGFAKVVNLGFRYTRDVLRDLDLSAQWPLGGRWFGVARYNRSLRDHRVTEALAGLEYDGGCWVFRTVYHRFATTEQDVTQAIFLQLELNDLASVGSSPLDLLRRTVGGYGTINQSVADPVFGR